MNREDAIREQIERFGAIVGSASGAEDFSTQLVGMQAAHVVSAARAELDALFNRELDIHFEQLGDNRTTITTTSLGRLLTQFQSVINFLLWALRAGPGVQGTVPADILRSASTDVFAVAPGSLNIAMRRTNLEMTNDFDKSVELILSLIAGANARSLGEEAADMLATIGPIPSARLQRLVGGFAEADIQTELEWHGEQAKRVHMSPEDAGYLRDWLARSEAESRDITVRGVLRSADTRSGKFTLESEGGVTYEGRAISPDLLGHAELDAFYETALTAVLMKNPILGSVKERFTLVRITRVNQKVL